MKTFANLIAGVLVLAHLGFFVGEIYLYDHEPWFREGLGLTSTSEPPPEAVVIAQNQAFSNLFLAVGIAVGLFLEHKGRRDGRSILMLMSAFIAVAGLVGFATIQPEPIIGKAAFLGVQFLLGSVSLVLWFREIPPAN